MNKNFTNSLVNNRLLTLLRKKKARNALSPGKLVAFKHSNSWDYLGGFGQIC